MKTVFVFVKCELGKAYDVAREAIDSIEEVSEVFSISGHFDLLVRCHLGDAADIGHFVIEKLQRLPHVKDTETLITFNAFS